MNNKFNDEHRLLSALRDGNISIEDALKKIKNKEQDFNELIYCQEYWEKDSLNYKSRDFENVVLFDIDKTYYNYLKNEFPNIKVILILPGEHLSEIEKDIYVINPQNYNEYVDLFEKLIYKKLDIIYLWNKDSQYKNYLDLNEESLSEDLSKSFYGLFYISKILMKMKEINEVIISYGYEVSSSYINPINDSISAFFKDLVSEGSKFKFKIIKFKNHIDLKEFTQKILLNIYNCE